MPSRKRKDKYHPIDQYVEGVLILIKKAEVYGPEPLGRKDVLVAGGKILAVDDAITKPDKIDVDVVTADGLLMIPGLIDAHVHIAGAGGEGGPATRTPELVLGQLLEGGITSVVGCLGTDGLTRNLESVLMKVKALLCQGVSAW